MRERTSKNKIHGPCVLYEKLISHTDQNMVKYMDILAFSIKKIQKTVEGLTNPAVFVYRPTSLVIFLCNGKMMLWKFGEKLICVLKGEDDRCNTSTSHSRY